MEDLKDQGNNSQVDRIKPWQFQPGQSGNPAGRPPGSSMKDYAKKYLSGMTDKERIEFFKGIDKHKIWEMAEGKAASNVDVTSGGKPIVSVSPEVAAKNQLDTDETHTGSE